LAPRRLLLHGALISALIVSLPRPEHALAEPAQGSVTSLPKVVSARLPSYPQVAQAAKIQGTVVVRVTTDGSAVASAEIVKSIPLLEASIKEHLRSWRFAPHIPTTFDVTYAFALSFDSDGGCATPPREVTARFPSLVSLIGTLSLCDAEVQTRSAQAAVRGILTCDCPGKAGIGDARITVLDSERRQKALTTTDVSGRFVVLGLRAGEYHLRAEKDGFEQTLGGGSFIFTNGRGQPIEVFPRMAPELLRWLQGDTPLYPERLRERGLEGLVQLRLERGRTIRVSGDAALLDAAEANLSTWQYARRSTTPFDVTYRYVLRAPADCATDSRETVTVREDGQVTVTACRR